MTKIKFNTQLFSLLCIVVLIGVETSCTKEDSLSSSQKVELFSFGPAGVQLGDTISFIGINLDRVQEIVFVGDSVPKASFVSQTSTLIKVIVPQNATRGYVILRTTTDGSIVTKTMIDFLVPVTITSMSKQARPGDNITITGTNMTWVTEIWFTNNVVVKDTNFVSRSMSQIVVKVPLTAQTGPLTFNTAGTKPLSITSDSDLIVTLPAITGFSPNPIAQGSNVTITGTNLDLVNGILFNGITDTIKTFVSQSTTQIVVTVPQGTNNGAVTLLPNSLVPVISSEILTIALPMLAPLAYAFYDDAIDNNWSELGWGRDVDYYNSDFVRDGKYSMKVTYTSAYSGVAFENNSILTNNYTEVAFSIYGGPGTDGDIIYVKLNWNDPSISCTIKEGEWQEFRIPLSTFASALGNPAEITVLLIGNTTWTGTVYLDHIGLR